MHHAPFLSLSFLFPFSLSFPFLSFAFLCFLFPFSLSFLSFLCLSLSLQVPDPHPARGGRALLQVPIGRHRRGARGFASVQRETPPHQRRQRRRPRGNRNDRVQGEWLVMRDFPFLPFPSLPFLSFPFLCFFSLSSALVLTPPSFVCFLPSLLITLPPRRWPSRAVWSGTCASARTGGTAAPPTASRALRASS